MQALADLLRCPTAQTGPVWFHVQARHLPIWNVPIGIFPLEPCIWNFLFESFRSEPPTWNFPTGTVHVQLSESKIGSRRLLSDHDRSCRGITTQSRGRNGFAQRNKSLCAHACIDCTFATLSRSNRTCAVPCPSMVCVRPSNIRSLKSPRSRLQQINRCARSPRAPSAPCRRPSGRAARWSSTPLPGEGARADARAR